MVFPHSTLRLVHDDGFGIEFNSLDALRLVDSERDLMKVAVAEAWKESRLHFPIFIMLSEMMLDIMN